MVTHAEGTQLSGELSLTQKSDLAAPCWCCSGTQLCPTLFDPVDCSTAGFPVHRSLLEFAYALSWSLLKLISVELVLPSNHLILCCSLLLLPSIFPSIRVFSNESTLRIRWPKNWGFSVSPSNQHSGFSPIYLW